MMVLYSATAVYLALRIWEKRALELYLHTLPVNQIIFVSSVFRKEYSKRNLISGLGFFFNYPISEGQVNMSHVIGEFI